MAEDVDGNRFMDSMAGIAVNITGHCQPQVVQAIKQQSDKFLHICSTEFYYEAFLTLCERLAEIIPIAGRKKLSRYSRVFWIECKKERSNER